MPRTTRSAYVHRPTAARSTQKTKSRPTRTPPSAHPSAPSTAASPSSSDHAFSRLSALALRPGISGFVVVRVALVLGEPARRPIGLRCVAAARAMERRDVLQRDEDV